MNPEEIEVPEKPSDDDMSRLLFEEPEFGEYSKREEISGEEEEVEVKEEEPAKVEEPAEVHAGAEPAADPAAEAADAGVSAPVQAPASDAVELLKQELEEMKRRHDEDRELWKQSLAKAQVPSKEEAKPQERKQVFALNVPDKLGEELLSEDPATRQRALVYYTNALAHEVYYKTREDLLQEMQQIARNTATGTVAQVSAQEEIAKDFYGTYPELAKPQYGPHIMNIAAQVMSEMGTQSWSPRVRDEVGRRSKELFGVSSTTPTAPVVKPAVASVRPGNGSRPPVVQPKSRQDSSIAGLLGLE